MHTNPVQTYHYRESKQRDKAPSFQNRYPTHNRPWQVFLSLGKSQPAVEKNSTKLNSYMAHGVARQGSFPTVTRDIDHRARMWK